MGKEYIDFDPAQGYPQGDDLFYECQSCQVEIPSCPTENLCCKCFNLFYDVDEAKLSVQNQDKIALFRKV